MEPNEMTAAKNAAKKPTLSELLIRSLDEDQLEELEQKPELERWDEDEGSFGG